MVRLVTQVMWYPRATSPYMLPSASPLTTSWRSIAATLLHVDGDDLAVFPDHHHVVRVGQRVVLLGREGLPVGLDEARVLALETLERVADLRALGAARLLDRHGDQMQAVVGVRRAHGRDHVLGALHAVLLAKRL